MFRPLTILLALYAVTFAESGAAAAPHRETPRETPRELHREPDTTGMPLFSFGVITDVHYSTLKPTKGTRHYAASEAKVREAVETFEAAGVDFVVSLGDMIDGDIESYARIDAELRRLPVPIYAVAGNHDFTGPYGSDTQRRVMEELGLRESGYSVVKRGWRLLFLDSNSCSTYARAAGTADYAEAAALFRSLQHAGRANAEHYNGGLGERQRAWLAGQLDEAERRGEAVICLTHMPLLPLDGKFTLWDNRQTAALLESHPCVKAYLAGHHHAGGCGRLGNVFHFTFQGMIEGEQNHYAIVEVYADRLVIRGYGAQPDATATLR